MTFRLLHLYILKSVGFFRRKMDTGCNQPLLRSSDEYTEVYRRLPLRLQLAYGVGHVLNDVCASIWFTYLIVYFHYVQEFSNWEAGVLILVGQIADALATPFVGFHSDQAEQFWLCRYGRRKIWHLLGTICVIFAFPFIFSPCPGCTESKKWALMFYYCIFIVIFQFGWAAVQISHLSLIPELTPNEHDRTKLTAIRYSFTVVSNVLVYVIAWITLHVQNGSKSKIGPNDGPKFRTVVWSVLSFGTLCSLIFHCLVREAGIETSNVRGGQIRSTVGEIMRTFRVYQVAVIYMTSRLFVNLTQILIPLYLHETLDMAASNLALLPLIMFISSFASSLVIEPVNRRCGRKITYFFGTVMGILACIMIRYGDGTFYVDGLVYFVVILIGAAGSIVLVTSLGVTTDLIGERTDNGAFIFGIMSFTDKFANGIAVAIIQYLHSNKTTYYRDILVYVCGASILMGLLSVLFLIKGSIGRSNSVYETIPENSNNPIN